MPGSHLTPEQKAEKKAEKKARARMNPNENEISATYTAGPALISDYKKLKYTDKGGSGKNSTEYANVINSLVRIIETMNGNTVLSGNVELDLSNISEILPEYDSFEVSCTNYIGKKSASHTRKKLVRLCIDGAEQDKKHISAVIAKARQAIAKPGGAEMRWTDIYPELAARGDNLSFGDLWNSILRGARTRKLVVNFDRINQADSAGGAVSEVYHLTGENTKEGPEQHHMEDDLFYKPQFIGEPEKSPVERAWERYNQMYPNSWVSAEFENTYNKYFYSGPDEIIRNAWLKHEGNVSEDPRLSSKKAWKDAELPHLVDHDYVLAKLLSLEASMTTNTFDRLGFKRFRMEQLGLNDDARKPDVTARNVATSRMADLLGLSNLVTRSDWATVTDAKNSKIKKKGIIMEKARGEKAGDVYHNPEVNKIDKLLNDTGEVNQDTSHKKIKQLMEIQYIPALPEVTGCFMKALSNLQVLDALCGQVDRHSGNYFVGLDNNQNLSDVHGIDNDCAFGLYDQDDAQEYRRVFQQGQDGTIHMVLPYLDSTLCETIKNLTDAQVFYALADVLNPAEIDITIARLNKMKAAIADTEAHQDREHPRIISDTQWNDNINIIKTGMAAKTQTDARNQTYYTHYINCKDRIDQVNRRLAEAKTRIYMLDHR